MPPRNIKQATYKGSRAKPTPPTDQHEEDELASSEEESGVGKLFDEMDDEPLVKPPPRSRGKVAGPAKSILKKVAPGPTLSSKKAVAAGTSKAITTPSLTKAVVDKLPKVKGAKETRRAYSDIQSGSEDEEEKEREEKEKKVGSGTKSKPMTKVISKQAPPPTESKVASKPAQTTVSSGRKYNPSKISTSGDSSGSSSLEGQTSANTKKNAIISASSKASKSPSITPAQEEVSSLSADKPSANDNIDNLDEEDEFGLDFNSDQIDAIDQDLAAKGLSSSPGLIAKAKSTTVSKVRKCQIGFQSSPQPIAIDPPTINNDAVEPADAAAAVGSDEDQQTSSQLSDDPQGDDGEGGKEGDDEDELESQVLPHNEGERSRKRALAEYDTNALADSEGGTAGLLLDDMSSAAKKPRVSGSVNKTAKRVKATEDDNGECGAQAEATIEPKSPKKQLTTTRTPAKPKATPKSKKSTKAQTLSPTPPLPALDYEVLSSSYDKETIQKLLIAKLEASKTCDWYELSLQLAKEGIRKRSHGKRGKKVAEMISGNDLHDLYHHVVLPAIRGGVALWESDGISSPETTVIQTPLGEDIEDIEMADEEYESEEEEMVPPKPTRSGRSAPRQKLK